MSYLSMPFNFNAGTVEPPGNQQVRLDNVDPTLATKMWVSYTSSDGADVGLVIPRIPLTAELTVSDFNDSTKHHTYDLLSITDKSSYAEYNIAWLRGAGVIPGGKATFTAVTPELELPAGGATGDVLMKASAVDYDAVWSLISGLPTVPDTMRPTVAQVATLLRARTRNTQGDEFGTFTADTRPTDSQVEDTISLAIHDTMNKLDTEDIPEDMYATVQVLNALLSAMLVELSYFPDQVSTNRSAYPEYKRLYDDWLQRMTDALLREEAEEAAASGNVSYSFPEAEPLWTKVM
jgi:hypothetical protein